MWPRAVLQVGLRGWLAVALLAMGCQAAPPSAPVETAPQPAAARPAEPAAASSGSTAGGAAASAAAAPSANPFLPPPGERPTRIKYAVCAIGGAFMPAYVARDAGLFARYGLDAEFVQIRGIDLAFAALETGEVDFVYCTGTATIPLMAAGIDAVMIGMPLSGLPYRLLARPEIQSVRDLKGKSVAVFRMGDFDNRLVRDMLRFEGMSPDDATLRPVGGQTERYQALMIGAVDATMVTPPLDAQGRRDGLRDLFKFNQLTIPFVYIAAHTTRKTARERPEIVQRFVAATAEAVHYAQGHKAEAEAALAKELMLEAPDVLESAYQAYTQELVNPTLVISPAAVQDALDDVVAQGGQVRRTAEDLIDDRFVRQLADSGFLTALWGRPMGAR